LEASKLKKMGGGSRMRSKFNPLSMRSHQGSLFRSKLMSDPTSRECLNSGGEVNSEEKKVKINQRESMTAQNNGMKARFMV
jgi:hypothetical protein